MIITIMQLLFLYYFIILTHAHTHTHTHINAFSVQENVIGLGDSVVRNAVLVAPAHAF